MKRCTKCGVEKELPGRRRVCNECKRAMRRGYTARYQNGSSRHKWLAAKRRSNEKHRARRAEEWAIYYAENREKLLARQTANYDPVKKRAARDPAKMRENARQRIAREKATFRAPVVEEEIILRDEGYCGICGDPIMELTIEIDHIIPLAAGGWHGPDNVQLAHRSCNRWKWMRLPSQD